MADRHVTNEQPQWAMVPEALLYDPAMSDKAVRLYGVLRRHGDDPTNCYPSKRRMADLMGCASSSLGRPLRELEDAGWIERVGRTKPTGEPDSNGYHVRLVPTSSAAPAQENAYPPRTETEGVRAPERDEREPLNESQGNETPRAEAAALELVIPEGPTVDPFVAFWKLYPRGDGKPAATKAWQGAIQHATPERIMEGLAAWVSYWEARNAPEFVPWAQKWLNQHQWNATPPAVQRGTGPSRPPIMEDRAASSGTVTDL